MKSPTDHQSETPAVAAHRTAIADIITTLRPAHWLKNLLVLAPLFFSGSAITLPPVIASIITMLALCMAASHIYIINDLTDLHRDSADPSRSARPFAAGRVTTRTMYFIAIATLTLSIICIAFIPLICLPIILAYIFLMYFYTLVIKPYVLLGAVTIATGMLTRVLAGAAAIQTHISPWVIPIVFFFAIYIVAGKRVYYRYGKPPSANLNLLFISSAAVTAITYIAYTLSDTGPEIYATHHLWITAPVVVTAIARYYFLMKKGPRHNREHLAAIIADPITMSCVIIWITLFTYFIYYPPTT